MASKVDKKDVDKSVLYRDKLDTLERNRYIEKLKFIDGKDPLEDSEVQTWMRSCESVLPSVSHYDILCYLMFSTSAYTRDQLKCLKGLDAYNQFVCGWVSDRRAYLCLDQNHVAVTAKVLHSQRLREKALRPWVVAEKGGVVVCSHCDCQAGLGEVCTHIAALLFSIEAVTRIRDEKTVTEKPAYWKLPPEMKKIEYNRICELDMTSAKNKKRKLDNLLQSTPVMDTPKPKQKEIAPPTQDEMNLFYDELFRTTTKPVVLATIEPYCSSYVPRLLTEEFPRSLNDIYNPKLLGESKDTIIEGCKTILESLKVSEEQSKNVEFSTRLQYKSKLWNNFRAGRITASKARAAVKTNPVSPSQSLIKSICYPDSTKFTCKATQWGCDNELTAQKDFVEQMQPFHENFVAQPCGFFIDTNHFYVGASPDAIVSCDCCGSFLLEIKCPHSAKDQKIYNNVQYLVKSNDHDGRYYLNTEHPYYYQVQTQLGVTGKDMCFFVVWTSKDIHVERIMFNEDFYSEICSQARVLFEASILPELLAKSVTKPKVSKPVNDVLKPLNQNTLTQRVSGSVTSNAAESCENIEIWCHCRKEEHGRMVACDGENCKKQWFHVACVGLKKVPRGKWYCSDCKNVTS